MTCAACANRIEKKLNRLDGVTATVNYATEKANVTFDTARISPDQLVEAVESIGYGAVVPQDEPSDEPDATDLRLADLDRQGPGQGLGADRARQGQPRDAVTSAFFTAPTHLVHSSVTTDCYTCLHRSSTGRRKRPLTA